MISMGALEIFLDKGEEWDWFGSPWIRFYAITFAISIVALVWWEMAGAKEPIMAMRYSTNTEILPCASSFDDDYGRHPECVDSAAAAVHPAVARLYGHDCGFGALRRRYCFAFLVPNCRAGRLALSRAQYHRLRLHPLYVRVFLLGNSPEPRNEFWLCHVAAHCAGRFDSVCLHLGHDGGILYGLPRELNNQVSGLINFARNIGGSILISLTGAFVTESTAFHQNNYLQHLHPGDPAYQQRLQSLTGALSATRLGPANAAGGAAARIYSSVQSQTSAQGYVDVYFALAAASAIMVLLTFLLDKNNPREGAKTEIAVHSCGEREEEGKERGEGSLVIAVAWAVVKKGLYVTLMADT